MDGGFPFAVVGVQNKAAFRMNRSAGKNRLPGNRLILTAQPQLLKNILEHVSGHPVNGDPERALVVVLAQQGDPAHEIRVGHGGHGNQRLLFKVAHNATVPAASPDVGTTPVRCLLPRTAPALEACELRVVVSASYARRISAGRGAKGADSRTMRMAASSRTS